MRRRKIRSQLHSRRKYNAKKPDDAMHFSSSVTIWIKRMLQLMKEVFQTLRLIKPFNVFLVFYFVGTSYLYHETRDGDNQFVMGRDSGDFGNPSAINSSDTNILFHKLYHERQPYHAILSRKEEHYLLAKDSILYRIDSCNLCGPNVSLCDNSEEQRISQIELDSSMDLTHIVNRTFSCRQQPQLLSWVKPLTFVHSWESPNEIYFISSTNQRIVVPTCHACSPRTCDSSAPPRFLWLKRDEALLQAVSKEHMEAYMVNRTVKFHCDMVPKELVKRPSSGHHINNRFIHMRSRVTDEIEYFYLKNDVLFPVDSCTPCHPSPMTHCNDATHNLLHELIYVPPVELESMLDGMDVSDGRKFRCVMDPLMLKRRAALFTNYHITPGGGEKYLLETARSFQQMGYTVDLYTKPYNVAETTEAVLEVASQLNVDLDPDRFRYIFITEQEQSVVAPALRALRYDIFFLIGNEKIPTFPGIGQYNIYQCQFPFDLDRGEPDYLSLRMLTGYDIIWVNSQFTRNWMIHYSERWLGELRERNLDMVALRNPSGDTKPLHTGCDAWRNYRWPQVDIMFPPARVTKLQHATSDSERDDECPWIVLLGRVFQGRQSKGHALAIEMYIMIREEYPDICVRLGVAGHIMPGHEAYGEGLKLLGKKQDVEFHYNADESEVYDLLSKATVQWHLTGSLNGDGDPASFEHFGISIVEGMSKGAIPVVLNRGGPPEIVTRNVGRTVETTRDFIHATVEVLNLNPAKRDELSQAAKQRAKMFSEEEFKKKVAHRTYRGQMEQTILEFVPEFAKTKQLPFNPPKDGRCARKFGCAALIVEFRDTPMFGLTVRNTMQRLGPNWKLHVVTLKETFPHVMNAIRDVLSGEKISRPSSEHATGELTLTATSKSGRVCIWQVTNQLTMDTSEYSSLFKKAGFWQSFQDHDGILVFQVDAIMSPKSTNSIYDFVKFDFVGAPWCKDNPVLQPLVDNGVIKYYVGNGGFSWRTVKSMIECSRKFGPTSDESEPEDRMFVRCFSKDESRYKVAPWEIAKQFSVEVPCWDLDKAVNQGKVPLALHATWYYTREGTVREALGVDPISPECVHTSYCRPRKVNSR